MPSLVLDSSDEEEPSQKRLRVSQRLLVASKLRESLLERTSEKDMAYGETTDKIITQKSRGGPGGNLRGRARCRGRGQGDTLENCLDAQNIAPGSMSRLLMLLFLFLPNTPCIPLFPNVSLCQRHGIISKILSPRTKKESGT